MKTFLSIVCILATRCDFRRCGNLSMHRNKLSRNAFPTDSRSCQRYKMTEREKRKWHRFETIQLDSHEFHRLENVRWASRFSSNEYHEVHELARWEELAEKRKRKRKRFFSFSSAIQWTIFNCSSMCSFVNRWRLCVEIHFNKIHFSSTSSTRIHIDQFDSSRINRSNVSIHRNEFVFDSRWTIVRWSTKTKNKTNFNWTFSQSYRWTSFRSSRFSFDYRWTSNQQICSTNVRSVELFASMENSSSWRSSKTNFIEN